LRSRNSATCDRSRVLEFQLVVFVLIREQLLVVEQLLIVQQLLVVE
jgi:hypothetical protein